jgi:hypothetical protein
VDPMEMFYSFSDSTFDFAVALPKQKWLCAKSISTTRRSPANGQRDWGKRPKSDALRNGVPNTP